MPLSTRRHGRPPEATALVVLFGLAAALCTYGALFPPTAESPAELNAFCAALAVVVAGVFWARWRVLKRWWLHTAVTIYVVGATALVSQSATGEGAVSIASSYTWICLYAAVVIGHRPARFYAVLAVAMSGAAFTISVPRASGITAWLVVSTSTLAVTEIAGRAYSRLRSVAVTDPLTGALNRTGLELAARREIADSRRHGTPLSIAVIDLDGFKLVNDREGHAAGDELLAGLVEEWRRQVRPRDELARYGGDEFVLLLPATTSEEAAQLMTRLRASSPAAWSYGIATIRRGEDLVSCVARADERMYASRTDDPDRPSAGATPPRKRAGQSRPFPSTS